MEQIIKKPTEIGVLMVAQPINMIRKFVGQSSVIPSGDKKDQENSMSVEQELSIVR
jgi:hypothetical protein